MKTVIKAMTRTKEMTVMVPMKMSSCLIWSSEMTCCCCSATSSLLANKELLRGPASMAPERLWLFNGFEKPRNVNSAAEDAASLAARPVLTCCAANLGRAGPAGGAAMIKL